MQQYEGGIVFTNHALDRLKERGISQDKAVAVFKTPDRIFSGKKAYTKEYVKRVEEKKITLIAKQNEKGEWVILSVWIDPPLAGSKDAKRQQAYQEYKRSSGLKKFFLVLKQQLGL
ncbi:MAG: DUF4258 domain-containing protein [Candidatus Levybacteria bacterium]|nr:DUF4258 domain-containing protein [Candidatus Levybacteria bacterium]